ncbi:unnamed protein product [Leptidea sinapis]|uniref:Uncharacterized protein n=1 Tax=Leptidea sinapis TaxID=189913 RepID=A0A5E4Q7N6_9NEOP|nr:unnamed protein product [Leptidea sinapis]
MESVKVVSEEKTSIEELETNLVNKESVAPSAPLLHVSETYTEERQISQNIVEVKNPILPSMALEEAIRIYGGKEIAEVHAISEQQEAIVEAGPLSGPDHPLVDLLSTFRSSLIARDRERITIECGYLNEDKNRSLLWRIEKKHMTLSEKCSCGANVNFKAVYDHAELQKNKLPAAKLRLEGLLRDVQDSYCHYQHTALTAHYQIEQILSETVHVNKGEVREALSLIFQSLRLTDGVPSLDTSSAAQLIANWRRGKR